MWRTTILLWIIWLTSTAYYFGTFLLATSLFRFHEHCSEFYIIVSAYTYREAAQLYNCTYQMHATIKYIDITQLFASNLDAGGLPNLDVCKTLQPEDYIGIMWTTSSELPGIILIAFLFPFFGRRVLMAGGLTLCAIFTSLLYLCQPRYVYTINNVV